MWMVPIFKLFGIVDGNRLSPFATSINAPGELSAMIEQFFKKPKQDQRGRGIALDGDDSLEKVEDEEELF